MKDNSKPTPAVQPETQPSLLPEKVTQPQVTQPQPSKTLWYAGGGIVVLLLAAGLFTLMQKPKTSPPSTQQPVVQQPALSPKPTLPRSKTPGVITSIQTASALDAQGKAVALVTTFAKTDKNIYLTLTINKPTIGTKIEYIRYLNGKYLDSGTNKLLKDDVTNTSFAWSLKKTGAIHLVGTYKVKVYTNGVFEKETSYTVQ
jgi:hypothetical protein